MPSRTSPRPNLLLALAALLAVAVALVAAGCGGGGGDENADPASIAPKGAPVFFSAYIRPQGEQKTAVEAISRKVAGVSNPGAQIENLLERQTSRSGAKISFKQDVKPWLGRRAAVVASAFSGGGNSAGAGIVAAKDTGKANDFFDKVAKQEGAKSRSYKGVDYHATSTAAYGVVGDFAVAGNEPEFKRIVDASKGSSLKDDSRFSSVAGQANGKLAFGYVDLRGLVDALGSAGRLPAGQGATVQSLLQSNQPITLTVAAKPNQVTMDVTGPAAKSVSSSKQASVIGSLPGDSFAAFGLSNVGGTIKRAVAQFASGGIGGGIVQTLIGQLRARTGLDFNRDIVAAIGDVGFFASGTSPLTVGGGAVITSPDPAAAKRLVAKLGLLIARTGARSGVRVSVTSVAGASGVRITSPKLPGGINLVTKGRKLVAAYGSGATRSALSSGPTLASTPSFQQASASLGTGATPSLYVGFGPIAQLVGAGGGNASAVRVLNALRDLVAGGTQQGGQAVARVVVNLK